MGVEVDVKPQGPQRRRPHLASAPKAMTPETWVRRNYWGVVLAILAVTAFYELAGWRWHRSHDAYWSPFDNYWDSVLNGKAGLLPAGSLTLAVGLWLAVQRFDRVYQVIDRLSARRLLIGNPQTLKDLMEARSLRGAAIGGPLVAGLMFAVFLRFADPFNSPIPVAEWLLTGLATSAGCLVGRLVGRAVAYGTLGRAIDGHLQWTLSPQRNSPDGASGLAPVGEMYFRSAGVLLIPAAFCAAWLWIWLIQGEDPNATWAGAFFLFVALALLMQVPMFVLPMLAFHRQMRTSCRAWNEDIDRRVCPRLAAIEADLISTEDEARRRSLREDQVCLEEQFRRADRCPTWPVDTGVRRRISISNAFLLVPLVGQVLTGDLMEAISGLGRVLG